MGDRQQAISYLTQVKRDMLIRKEQMLRPVQQLEKEIEHITAALALVLREPNKDAPKTDITDFPLERLRRLSHRQAVIEIARYQGGTVRAQDAKRILIESGCMSKTKNSTNMTHNAIVQSGAFERIGKGEYRLRNWNGITPKNEELEAVARVALSAKPVQ
jgi:hypothetical protein